MASEVPLRQLCELVVDCPHSTPVWTESGKTVLRSKNIRGGRLDLSERSFTDDAHFLDRIRRARPQGGDIVITREAPMGECAMLPDALECCLGQRMVLLRPDASRVVGRYLLYALQSPRLQRQIGMHEGTGSTVSNLRIPALEALLVPSPSLRAQSAIASILGALDDKIELNRKMIRNLDGISQAIFKSWFIDLDRVSAMDAQSGLPAGWQWVQLGRVVENLDRRRVPLSSRERAERSGTYPYYGAAGRIDSVDDYLFDGEYVLVGEDGSVIDENDRPVVQYVWGKFWVNNHAHVLQGCGGVSNEQLVAFLRQVNVRPYITGAVQPKLNQGNLNRIPFLLADASTCAEFDSVAKPLFARSIACNDEALILERLRDALLPGLLSGELPIQVAEKVVEEVV